MNSIYDILNKLNTLTESKKPAAPVEQKETVEEARVDAIKAKMEQRMAEADVEEGNDFTGARLAAIKAGKPTFKVGGKTYKVTGDTSDEKVMEREYGQRDDFDKYGRPGDTIRTAKGTLTKTATGVKHERRPEDEEDIDADRDDSAPRKRGRPAGSKRALGAKGPTGKSKLLKKGSIKEGELEEDMDPEADAGEYGREGDMAKEQLHTIEAAAEELSSILSDEQDLPEWVQKKITLAKEYVDTARDYMLAQEEPVAERKLTKAEEKKREEFVKGMKKPKGDFEKRYGDRGEEVMYATATKMAKKKAEESKDEVEETTTAGSVAAAPASGKAKGIFGKGIYEGQLEESFSKKLNQTLNEGMNVSINISADGKKNITVTADQEDAEKLAQLLQLAGLEPGAAQAQAKPCDVCGEVGCGCQQVEEDHANSPDEQYADTDTMVNTLSGGLNGPKLQVNPNNPGDNPLAMQALGQKAGPTLNLGEATEQRLMDLYKKFEAK